MAGYPPIKWTKAQKQRFSWATKEYNKTIERLRKKYPDVELPNKLDPEYEKRFITNRNELDLYVKSLRRLNQKKNQQVKDGQLVYGKEEVKRQKRRANAKLDKFSKAIEAEIDKNVPEGDRSAAKRRSRAKGNKPLEGEYTAQDVNELRRQSNIGNMWASRYMSTLRTIFQGYTAGGLKFYPEQLDEIQRILSDFMRYGQDYLAVIEFRGYYYLEPNYIYPNSADKDPWPVRAQNALDLWTKLYDEFFKGGPLAAKY